MHYKAPSIVKDQDCVQSMSLLAVLNPSELYYVAGIGYATLVPPPLSPALIPDALSRTESIHFDPSLFRQHSEPRQNLLEQAAKQEQACSKPPGQKGKEGAERIENREAQAVNIVTAKLEGTNVLIYTPETNLSKWISVCVKVLLPGRRERVVVRAQFGKTIDVLKKAVLEQLGERIESYYNIKLFATTPRMGELANHSRTLHQCGLKPHHTLLLTAAFNFALRPLPENIRCSFTITLNNNILTSSVKPPQPPPLPPVIALPPEGESQPAQREQEKGEVKDGQGVVEVKAVAREERVQRQAGERVAQGQAEEETFLALCNAQVSSGRCYWQVKAEKLPSREEELVIGLCVPPRDQTTRCLRNCSRLWAYYPLTARKAQSLEEQQEYGFSVRAGDVVGVLVIFQATTASVTFYVNAVSCGLAFRIDLCSLSVRGLVPFVSIGGSAQVSLDAQAAAPLDSYRLS